MSEDAIRRGKPYSELRGTNVYAFYGVEEIRNWREREHSQGRASELEDFYRAHGLCWTCQATGVTVTPVDWDGDTPLFVGCPVCRGTGKLLRPY